MQYQVRCISCKRRYNLSQCYTLCVDCGHTLDMPPSIYDDVISYYIADWEYKNFNIGNTSMMRHIDNCFFKLEYDNPTWSFKDRGTLLELWFALKEGYSKIVCASTGNMAVSITYFASMLWLTTVVFVPASTPNCRIDMIKKYGASVQIVKWNYDKCNQLAAQYAKNTRSMLCWDFLLRRMWQWSCAKELIWYNFDYIIIPIWNWTFWNWVMQTYFTKSNYHTTFVFLQWIWCAPIYQAWLLKNDIIPIQNPTTIWNYFKVWSPLEWDLSLELLSQYDGICDHISDKEMLFAQKKLLTSMIYINTTAASTYARYLKQRSKLIDKKICCILTGI